MIKSLHKDYVQKSRIFLYPILDIKRGSSVTPCELYVSWDGFYKPEDCKLIALYHLRTDDEFRYFERNRLFNNKYFHDYKEVENNMGVYVFDFSEHKQDWNNFINGKYSKLSPNFKAKIKNFTGVNDSSYAYVESFLHPEKYYDIYSDLVGETVETLRSVGELCSPPDLEKETLKIQVKSLDISNVLS